MENQLDAIPPADNTNSMSLIEALQICLEAARERQATENGLQGDPRTVYMEGMIAGLELAIQYTVTAVAQAGAAAVSGVLVVGFN